MKQGATGRGGVRSRENFRAAFHGFDIPKVAAMGEADVERLLQDAGIIRHRGKIASTINNAKRALEIAADRSARGCTGSPAPSRRRSRRPSARRPAAASARS